MVSQILFLVRSTLQSNLGQTWSTLVKLGQSWSNLPKLREMCSGPRIEVLFVENLNLMIMENIKERYRERGREWRLRFFKWFGYVSLRPHDVANGLHLYYILCMMFLDDYNVL